MIHNSGVHKFIMTRFSNTLASPLIALAICSSLPLQALAAVPNVATNATLELHKKGQYEEAVTRGLADLLSEPWNHELRFVVADSLQRLGRLNEATTQLEALEGTPFAEAATLRLNALRKAGQAPARKLSSQAKSPAPSGGAIQTAQPYQYVPPVSAGLRDQAQPPAPPLQKAAISPQSGAELPKKGAAEQRILDLNAAEDFSAVGTEGLALLATEKPDDALQLIIANSLAWTGRLNEAVPTYQGLVNGKYANEANVGLASIQRWRGRDDQAMPLYQRVLAADPGNAGALEGIELATRELVPRTLVSFGGSIDSSDMQRKSTTVNHRWRDRSGTNIMEVETSGVRDELPTSDASQQDVTLRYRALDLALKPSLELSMPTKSSRNLYGKAHLVFDDYNMSLDVGRVNWGKIATNPNALASHLAATTVGLEATQSLSVGDLTGRIDYFDISDGNNILTSSLRLASKWRPFGSHIKPFVGMETREASFNTPNYWSPSQGFGTAYVGLLGEWGRADWNFFTSAQAGAALYGDAGTSWSVSAGGKRWLSNDVAIGLNLWSMASWRDNAAYRAKSVIVNLEKLWR